MGGLRVEGIVSLCKLVTQGVWHGEPHVLEALDMGAQAVAAHELLAAALVWREHGRVWSAGA